MNYSLQGDMRIYKNSDTAVLIEESADALNQKLHTSQPILLLLSGGSALKLLTGIDTSTLGPHVTIGVLDERYSTDPTENNWAQIMSTEFFAKAQEQGCTWIDTRVQPEETQEQLAQRFETSLKTWRNEYPAGKGIIIATQGMGEDGHTSGVMPFPEDPETFATLFYDENNWVVGYDASGKNHYPLRVTTTLSFMKHIDVSIFYVTGKSKESILQAVLSDGSYAEYPARIIHEMPQVLLFTDTNVSC